MGDKRIWMVIGCIFVIGVSVTLYTNSFVSSREGALNASQAAAPSTAKEAPQRAPAAGYQGEEQTPGEEEIYKEGISQAAGARDGLAEDALLEPKAAPAPRSASVLPDQPDGQEQAAKDNVVVAASGSEDKDRVNETVRSPLETDEGPAKESAAVESVDYRQRLLDLDAQISRMNEENRDATAYSMKSAAQSEYRLWESEMESIYETVMERLDKKEAEQLAAQQQEWLRDCGRKAAKDAKKRGVSLESVGYISSACAATRARAYELVDQYESILEQQPD